MQHKKIAFKGIILLATLTLAWGFNWPMMKYALTEIPPWTFRMYALFFGSAGFIILIKSGGQSLLIPKKEIKPIIIVSLLNITGWQIFSAYGISRMNAGRASVIAFTMPVWAAVFSSLLLKEKMTLARLTGLFLGIGGIAVLIGADLRVLGTAPIGVGFMLLAAVSWAAGTVAVKYFKWTIPMPHLICWQLIFGGVPVVVGAIMIQPSSIFAPVSFRCILAMIYVIIPATIYSYYAWFKIVSIFPATVASIGILLTPVVGVFSGALVLGEQVGMREIISLILVVSAVSIVMLRNE